MAVQFFDVLRRAPRAWIFTLLLLGLAGMEPGAAHAALQVKVDQGVTEPIPLAIPDFLGNSTANRDIAGVVRADLERSGLFKSLNPASFIEKIADINAPPHFADWRSIQAQGLVTGQATMQTDGRLKVEFRLWDIFGETQMVGLQYMTTPENWRRIAHLVSDAIYERITGEKGYFDTRIVFISESGPKLNRRKRLAVMDQDGANPVFLTQGDYHHHPEGTRYPSPLRSTSLRLPPL